MRIGRRQYWLFAGLLLALQAAMAFLDPGFSGAPLMFTWFLVYAWRLHDFGRSAWWAALLLAVMTALVVAIVVVAPDAFDRFWNGAPIEPPAGQTFLFDLLFGACLVLNVGSTIWLGIQPGDPGPNRYGLRWGARAAS